MALAFRSRDHHVHASQSASVTRAMLLKALETKYPTASSAGQGPTIPDPEVFVGLSVTIDHDSVATKVVDSEPKRHLPSIAECAVHLRLLEACSILKQKVLTSNALDRAFGIAPKDSLTTIRGKRVRKTDTTFAERRKVKWDLFVRFAARRFLFWWSWSQGVTTRNSSAASSGVAAKSSSSVGKVAEVALPPLDVLMVWHAFLLNPSAYREFCTASARSESDALKRLTIKFPWGEIHNALSDDNRSYIIPSDIQSQLSGHVGPPDLFEALADVGGQLGALRATVKKPPPSLDENNDDRLIRLRSLPNPKMAVIFGTSEENKQRIEALAAMVKGQDQFADKMANMLWLRSPALGSTLERAIIRYERFLILSKETSNPGSLVATLDIDLVWNTHLCSADLYRDGCMHFAGRELERKANHNDTLKESESVKKKELEDELRRTERLYELKFRDEYNTCLCWECEAIRTELESWKKKNKNSPEAREIDFAAVAKKAKEDVEYYQVVELARRTGKQIPIRMDTSSSSE